MFLRAMRETSKKRIDMMERGGSNIMLNYKSVSGFSRHLNLNNN